MGSRPIPAPQGPGASTPAGETGYQQAMKQALLDFWNPLFSARGEFIAGAANAEARSRLADWPDWHGNCLVLVGPEGCGKSRLAEDWAARTGARRLDPLRPDAAAVRAGPVLLEDVDQGFCAEGLFHLVNLAPLGGGVLMTARSRPAAWPAQVPDLRSRLNALPVAHVEAPDDEILLGVLEDFLRARGIRPAPDLAPYLVLRIDRSVTAARDVVERLHEASARAHRPVTRALAREILEDETENLDLFDP
ncbi:chromosomal replication initiator DnaA [Phenylobacterium sp.]|uniref:chromosomal replication initiator DnaA n=1 Tax=Phenylobacterium sp. TaxID=1871053 RepID=UPI002FDD55CE